MGMSWGISTIIQTFCDILGTLQVLCEMKRLSSELYCIASIISITYITNVNPKDKIS
jgi:hypothetical protein